MIIVKLSGGLGNQMFQYAMGRVLSIRNSTGLKLDLSGYKYCKEREYKLFHFNIKEDFATRKEILYFKPRHRQVIDYTVCKIKKTFYPWHMQKVIKENTFSYNTDILKVKGNAYLDGYWQSEKYFKDISEIIRKDFTLKNEPDETNLTFLEKIEAVNSVSLHIRRGDYLSNPENSKIHGLLDMDYYTQSLKLIAERIANTEIFVFSDDMEWAKDNLKISSPCYFAGHNGVHKDYEDLRLMSSCKNHIIANSSFSWWGAWLGKNPQKIVIAPKKWFNTDKKETKDLIPETWLRI